jgi:hypothetical protein
MHRFIEESNKTHQPPFRLDRRTMLKHAAAAFGYFASARLCAEASPPAAAPGPLSPKTPHIPETLVDSLSGRTQRKLLRALNGKGNVRISQVLITVYGTDDAKNMEALLKAKVRLNQTLTELGAGYEVKKQGETLMLSRL